MSSSSGSNAPLFTLPAWAQTMTGPSILASSLRSASGRIRPCSSDAILRTRSPSRPRPSMLSDANAVMWLPVWVMTVISGAPWSP